MNNNTTLLRNFFDRIWNTGDVTDVPQFIAPAYTIHSDPGDRWDGQTLTVDQFCERMVTSRAPFPDLTFSVHIMIDGGDCVVANWVMSGTHQAPLGDFPATGRTINIHGMTIYYVSDGRLTGHRQVVDRLAVLQQLGMLGG
jgi:steroid delta-isomerase-like uncharacterized protein